MSKTTNSLKSSVHSFFVFALESTAYDMIPLRWQVSEVESHASNVSSVLGKSCRMNSIVSRAPELASLPLLNNERTACSVTLKGSSALNDYKTTSDCMLHSTSILHCLQR